MAAEQSGIWDQPAGPMTRRENEPAHSGDAPRRRRRGTDDAPVPNGSKGSAEPAARSASKARDGGRQPSRRNRKVRRVHRVVRHVEVWSVFKVMAAFALCGYIVALVSGYLLWRAADRVGTISGVEGFFEEAGGYDRFELYGDVVFRSSAVLLALLAALAVFAAVLGAVLFNLISDLTGGIRMTVIDEDLIVTPVRRRPGAADSDLEPPHGNG